MTRSIPDNDEYFLSRLREGDGVAFGNLYQRYKGFLYVHAFHKLGDRELVLDIIQEVFTDLWERRAQVVIQHLPSYLHQAVRYRIIDHFAKQKVSHRYLNSLSDFAQNYTADTDHRIREGMLKLKIQKEIDALPPRMKEVFVLSRQKNLSHREISVLLGLTEQSVRSHIKNALKIMRKRLGIYWFVYFLMNI